MFEDCSNSVSQNGGEGTQAPCGIWCTWPNLQSGEAAMPEGQAALTGIPRETLVPKEGEASESSRLCQTHRQGGAQAHMGDQPVDPLVT